MTYLEQALNSLSEAIKEAVRLGANAEGILCHLDDAKTALEQHNAIKDQSNKHRQEFNDLLESDPDFNYSSNEFDKWLGDNKLIW